jgi:hypothetical protein
MNFKLVIIGIATGLALIAQPASANVVLSTDGATFVSASSQLFQSSTPCCGGFVNLGLTTAQDNLLTTTPQPWLKNGDTRFIFANDDPVQSIIIKLGSLADLDSFGATFSTTDRVPGALSVAVSTDGTTFSSILGSVSNPNSTTPGGSADLITLSTPVQAEYIEYFFGQAIGANGAPNGAGVSELFASPVPELSTWVMMILGFCGLGFLAHRRQKAVAFPFSWRLGCLLKQPC